MEWYDYGTNFIDEVFETTNFTTAKPSSVDDDEMVTKDDSLAYFIVPLGVFIVLIVLSALVYFMARTHRRMHRVPQFTFDETTSVYDEEDVYTERDNLLRDKKSYETFG